LRQRHEAFIEQKGIGSPSADKRIVRRQALHRRWREEKQAEAGFGGKTAEGKTMTLLKPCPKCGAAARLDCLNPVQTLYVPPIYYVGHLHKEMEEYGHANAHHEFVYGGTEAEAIEKWNSHPEGKSHHERQPRR
jgi:hypothetical protein